MIQVTWEWLGAEPALDVANTVTISNGVEHDLLEPEGEYERWAEIAAASHELDADPSVLLSGRDAVLRLRIPIRAVLLAAAGRKRLPEAAVAALNRVSKKAASWLELTENGVLHETSSAAVLDRVLASYARSAMVIAAGGSAHLRRCPAPSCGMFYRPTKTAQRWCSIQCGTRARVARHYARASSSRTPSKAARSAATR